MERGTTANESLAWRARIADYLSLERNVTIASAAIFLLGIGEELWKKFLPKYLEALGASAPIIGFFGTAEDFFDAVYQYPGGWLADHLGRRRSFLIFIALASAGYLVYLVSPSCNFRDYRRRAAARTSRDGFHSAIDFEASADCYSSSRRRGDDSRTGHYQRSSYWSFNHFAARCDHGPARDETERHD
jgi:MFS family permease